MSELLVIGGSVGGIEVDPITSDQIILPGHEHLSYSQVFDRYASSHFGEFQAGQEPRFSGKYAYDWADMYADLGSDVHPVDHMKHTEGNIARPFIAHQNSTAPDTVQHFSHPEIVAARLGALLHDIGECKHPELLTVVDQVIGDVNYFEKTEAHEAVEVSIRRHIYTTLFSDIPPQTIEQIEDMIAVPAGTHLREGFRAIEFVGYLLTHVQAGVVAVELLKTGETETVRFEQLRNLAMSNTVRWHTELEAQSAQFPYTGVVAKQHEATIADFQFQLA